MPTQATVDRHRRRAAEAERLLVQLRSERDALASQLHQTHQDFAAQRTEAEALQAKIDADPEAMLVADLQAAVDAYHARLRATAEARGRTNDFATYEVAPARREAYRPATESPLGRALLHLAQRHGVEVEATLVAPPLRADQQLISVPAHVADQLREQPYLVNQW